jgi:DNA gyrase/topoisomerase IV subunit A
LPSCARSRASLEDILGSPASLRRLMVKEIEADAKQFADARRTLIQAEKRAVAEVKVVDEPVTVVVSDKGWVRARQGHGHEAAAFAFKAGDGLYGTFECRTVDTCWCSAATAACTPCRWPTCRAGAWRRPADHHADRPGRRHALKLQPKGGRGLTLMDVDAKDPLLSVATCADALRVIGQGRGGKPKDEVVKGMALASHVGKRARKGHKVEAVLKPMRVLSA